MRRAPSGRFQITLGQNHAWQNKPINVSVANFPNFLAKLG
jgi:hypothetical protein